MTKHIDIKSLDDGNRSTFKTSPEVIQKVMNVPMCAVMSILTLSKILCKWKQDSVVSLFLYLDSVFKNKHKLIHNDPV